MNGSGNSKGYLRKIFCLTHIPWSAWASKGDTNVWAQNADRGIVSCHTTSAIGLGQTRPGICRDKLERSAENSVSSLCLCFQSLHHALKNCWWRRVTPAFLPLFKHNFYRLHKVCFSRDNLFIKANFLLKVNVLECGFVDGPHALKELECIFWLQISLCPEIVYIVSSAVDEVNAYPYLSAFDQQRYWRAYYEICRWRPTSVE